MNTRIQPFPGGMTPPSWVEVPAAITDWVRSLKSIALADNMIERIAAAHGRFERIHPFLDGNGHAGRLAMNLLLVRFGYPPAIIYTRDRNRYLNALRRVDAGDPGSLGEMVARAVLDNLYRFVVPAVAGPRRLVPLATLATKDRSVSTLRAAIERGRLRAQKGPDGQWRSTKAWVDNYLATKYRGEGTRLRSADRPRQVPRTCLGQECLGSCEQIIYGRLLRRPFPCATDTGAVGADAEHTLLCPAKRWTGCGQPWSRAHFLSYKSRNVRRIIPRSSRVRSNPRPSRANRSMA